MKGSALLAHRHRYAGSVRMPATLISAMPGFRPDTGPLADEGLCRLSKALDTAGPLAGSVA